MKKVARYSLAIGIMFSGLALAKPKANDETYFAELEKKAASLGAPQGELLKTYVHYLQTGKAEDADAYIRVVKTTAPQDESSKVSFSIFEGDLETCHMEDGACTRGLGELTDKYLVPRLKAGDRKALELLFVHTSLVSLDGADSQNLSGILKKQKIASKHKAYFTLLRKSDPVLVKFPNQRM